MCASSAMFFKAILFVVTLTIYENKCAAQNCTKWDHPPANIAPPNLEQILNYLKSQVFDLKDVIDIVCTQLGTILEALLPPSKDVKEDINLNLTQLITKYGYPIEEHKVTTEDGYILTMHRIPGKSNSTPKFIMHGLVCSSDDWITNGKDNALPYYLADLDYDVWMGNARGNKYSRQHVSISPDCAEFWDFSWHEVGKIDLPTMIDYVLEVTSQDKVDYIGYSQGTTNVFVLGSELPDYNKKLNVIVALAPVAWMCHAKSPLYRLLSLNPGLIYQLYGNHEVDANTEFSKYSAAILCGNNPLGKTICADSFFALSGFGCGELNVDKLPVIKSHKPGGSSIKSLAHYGQLIRSCNFCQFDYGKDKNLEVYGSEEPPGYNVENISPPVALFYSDYDWLSTKEDVPTLSAKLPNVIATYKFDNYGHSSFAFGKNLKTQEFPKILAVIKDYE